MSEIELEDRQTIRQVSTEVELLAEIQQVFKSAECLKNQSQVEQAIDQLAELITARLRDCNPIICCIMNGGIIFTGQLLTRLNFPLEVDYLHATRYLGETEGDELQWRVIPGTAFENRTVLIVDDILDEGKTLKAIVDACYEQNASEVLTAVLVDKIHNRKIPHDIKADFTAMEIEDHYLFGCGMDYKGYWRNLPGIYAVKQQK